MRAMRAFLALPIPEDTVAALVAAQGRLPFGRPVAEDNLHLTLAFLGDVNEAVLAEIDELLSGTPLPSAPVAFGGLGTFGEIERGLVFASIVPDPRLSALQSKVARVARMAGVDLPRRRFRPHVTLVRANRQPIGPARDRLAAALGTPIDIPAFVATDLVLYQSTLTPDGARHDALSHYPLFPISA
jgi:2'-5' RNA ligase